MHPYFFINFACDGKVSESYTFLTPEKNVHSILLGVFIINRLVKLYVMSHSYMQRAD